MSIYVSFAVIKVGSTEEPPVCLVVVVKAVLTLLTLGKQSRMENISLALPCGSSGNMTVSASTSIWYKHLVNSGSGSSLR